MVDGAYDVVVVGFGCAGVCAAIAAAEAGARVLALDRGHGGGASALSGGVVYAGGGTRHQHAAGYADPVDAMLAYLTHEVGDAVSEQTLRDFCAGSVERLEWLERHGARFDSSLCDYKTSYPTDDHYLYFSGNEKAHPFPGWAQPAPRGHRQVAAGLGSGKALWRALRDAALRLGVTFLPLSRVESLVVEDGQVRGVRCRTLPADDRRFAAHRLVSRPGPKLGNYYPPAGRRINAAASAIWRSGARPRAFRAGAVVLAADGFAVNREMVRRYAPAYAGVVPLGTEGDDGSGIDLGRSAGGSVSHLDRMTAWRFLAPPEAMVEGVAVGVDGTRITNEDLYGAAFSEALVHRSGGRGRLVLDARQWAEARRQARTQANSFQWAQLGFLFTVGHRRAPTLDALAGKLGISAAGLRDTVDAYNRGIAGDGDPAGKAPELCSTISRPPYYGIDISVRSSAPAYFVPGLTLGGLRVDGGSGLVLDEAGAEIPGLYAAGRTAVGVCSQSYVSGLSLADCVFSGIRAGRHAAANARGSTSGKPLSGPETS